MRPTKREQRIEILAARLTELRELSCAVQAAQIHLVCAERDGCLSGAAGWACVRLTQAATGLIASCDELVSWAKSDLESRP